MRLHLKKSLTTSPPLARPLRKLVKINHEAEFLVILVYVYIKVLSPETEPSEPQLNRSCCTNVAGNLSPEPVFLNVYGAPESIPRDEFRQPM
jgi:hypothetical protein